MELLATRNLLTGSLSELECQCRAHKAQSGSMKNQLAGSFWGHPCFALLSSPGIPPKPLSSPSSARSFAAEGSRSCAHSFQASRIRPEIGWEVSHAGAARCVASRARKARHRPPVDGEGAVVEAKQANKAGSTSGTVAAEAPSQQVD